jgi:hypothetical protein
MFWLAAAHVLLMILSSVVASVRLPTSVDLKQLPLVPCVALMLSQASLLSLWAVGSTLSSSIRLLGVVAGLLTLELLFPLELRHQLGWSITLTFGFTAVTLLLLRIGGVRVASPSEVTEFRLRLSKNVKVSIRVLMFVIATLASMIAGIPLLRISIASLFLVLAWAACFTVVGLSTFWGMLGSNGPRASWPATVVISMILGGFFVFTDSAPEREAVYFLFAQALYTLSLTVSLFVLRSCRYRIMRPSTAKADGGWGGGHSVAVTRPRSEGTPSSA